MRLKVGAPRDLAAGATFLLIGTLFLVLSFEHRLGTARSMGPAYFPTIVSTALIVTGLAVCLRGVTTTGPAIDRFRFDIALPVAAALIAFLMLFDNVGLVPATFVATLLLRSADRPFAPARSFLYSLLMSVFVWLLFAFLLGQNYPAFGLRA